MAPVTLAEPAREWLSLLLAIRPERILTHVSIGVVENARGWRTDRTVSELVAIDRLGALVALLSMPSPNTGACIWVKEMELRGVDGHACCFASAYRRF
jgi:hypothetical protein